MANQITKITLNGLNCCNMGDATEADAAGYREWIAKELEAEYPGVELELNEEDSTLSVVVEFDEEDDWQEARYHQEDVQHFCESAWERCNWEWAQ
jgi:hypothetical protein